MGIDRNDTSAGQVVVLEDFLSENVWRALILTSAAAVLIFSVYCLSQGITIIFMHLYYFPIVLLAYRYRYRGFVLATLLALAYVGLVIFFHPEQAEVTGAFYRFAVFIGIAAVVAYLSERLAAAHISQKEGLGTIRNLQQFQESVITNANVWITVLSPDGTIIVWNDAAEAISGYKRGDVLGKRTIWKALYPDKVYRHKVTEEIQRVIGRDTFLENFETEIRCIDGKQKTIVWNTRGIRDAAGSIQRYIAIGRDITEQKWAETALRESELNLREAQEIARLGQWELDLVHNILHWSDGIYQIFEIDPAEFGATYEAFLDRIHPDDRDGVNSAYTESVRTKKPYEILHRLLMKDGRVKWVNEICHTEYDAKGQPLRSVGIVQDISGIKQAEEALRLSETKVRKKLATILEPEGDFGALELSDIIDYEAIQVLMDDFYSLTGIGVAILDNSGKILVSTGWQDLCTKFHRVNEESRKYCLESDLDLSLGVEPGTFKRYKCKNNLWDIASPITVGGNQLGNLFLGQFFFDDEKPDRELFTRQAKRYGFDEKEYLSALDRVPRFSRDTVDTVMRFYTKFTDLISTLSYGNVRLARTLSERDLLLESLKKSEERFRTIFNNINDAVQIHEIGPDGKPGRFLDVNDAACRMLMVSREELLAHDPLDYATEYHNPPLKEVVRLLKKNGTATFETGHKRSDGIVVPVEINAHVISLMGKTVVLSVIRDISYRKKAEEKIRFANVILTTQQETSPDGILVVDEQGKILSFNRKFTEIWGIPQDVIDSRSDERALSFVIEKLSDPQEFLARVRYLYDNRDEKSIEEVLLKDGRVLKRYSAPMFGEDNRYYGRVWYFHDITDRKKAEQAIIRIAREWEATFNATSDGICLIDADQNIQRCNKRMGEILGGMKHEDFAGKPCWAIVHKTTGPIPFCPFVSAKETLTRTRVELPAGDLWFEVTADPILDSSGKFTGAVHIMRDITERKMAEDALRTSEEKYRTLFENMLEGFAYCRMVYDEKGHPVDFIYLNVNPAFDRIAGTKTVMGKPVTKVFPGIKEAFPSLFEIYGRVALTGEPESFDLDFKPSGKWLHISVNSPAKEHFVAVFEDITERKHMEDALRESRQLFADIIGFLPDATLVVDRDGKVIAWNRAIELLSGIPVQDMVGKGDYEYSIWETGTKRPILIDLVLHPDENYIQSHYIKVRREGNTITAETDFVRADGRIMALSLVASPLFNSNGEIIGAIESMHDITRLREAENLLVRINEDLANRVRERTKDLEAEVAQRKKAEEVVRASLEEKIVLLREVHHRVKNNLQILISLLNLQSRTITDPHVITALKESNQRIRAMSMVHEKLYTGGDLAHIEFINYLSSLANSQVSFYGLSPGKIKLEITGENIMLDINTAIPLGLVMNELVSNALKHAFPGDRKGIIRINAREIEERLDITFADDGIGVPEGFDAKTSPTLGLRLVNILIEQLFGTITLDRTGAGTVYHISIPKKER